MPFLELRGRFPMRVQNEETLTGLSVSKRADCLMPNWGFYLLASRPPGGRMFVSHFRPAFFLSQARNPVYLQALTPHPRGSFHMPSSADLRRRAAHCLRVAAAVSDRSVAAVLVMMADDFSAQADEIDPSLESTSPESTSLGSSGRIAADPDKAGRTH